MKTTLTTTLCFTAVLAAYSVLGAASEWENGVLKMKKGETFTVDCMTKDNKKDSLKIYARFPSERVLAFYDKNTNTFTLGKEYTERVNISGKMHKLTMRISDLQLSDSGLYIGLYSKFDLQKNEEEKEEGCSILMFVNDVDKPLLDEKPSLSEPLVLVFALTACTMLVVCFLVIWVLAPKVKAMCVNQAEDTTREYNPVYEDMHRVQK